MAIPAARQSADGPSAVFGDSGGAHTSIRTAALYGGEARVQWNRVSLIVAEFLVSDE
jgi:hypothetical protein